MSTNLSNDLEIRRRRQFWPWFLAAVVGLAVLGLALATWQGWLGDNQLTAEKKRAEAEAKQKEEETKKKSVDPRVERLVVQPGEPESAVQALKPGHWATGTERMRAIYREFVGQQRLSVVNRHGNPYPVDGTPLALESTRPVALAKGRPKEIETTFLVPQTGEAIEVRSDLVERGFGRTLPSREPVTRMPPYQYYFVVLAKEPNRYALLKTLDSVSVPWGGASEADGTEDPLDYRVVSLPVERTILLSDNSLTWTNIAYMLWDDVDPKLFMPEQTRALVDWLQWGGQLVVNGPDSLDLLKGSFLEPYLPATSGGSRSIAAGDLATLNEHWTIASGGAGRPLAPSRRGRAWNWCRNPTRARRTGWARAPVAC